MKERDSYQAKTLVPIDSFYQGCFHVQVISSNKYKEGKMSLSLPFGLSNKFVDFPNSKYYQLLLYLAAEALIYFVNEDEYKNKVTYNIETDNIFFTFSSSNDDVQIGLDKFIRMVSEFSFDKIDFEKIKKLAKLKATIAISDNYTLFNYNRLFIEDDLPCLNYLDLENIDFITPKELVSFIEKYFIKTNKEIIVVSKLDSNQLMEVFNSYSLHEYPSLITKANFSTKKEGLNQLNVPKDIKYLLVGVKFPDKKELLYKYGDSLYAIYEYLNYLYLPLSNRLTDFKSLKNKIEDAIHSKVIETSNNIFYEEMFILNNKDINLGLLRLEIDKIKITKKEFVNIKQYLNRQLSSYHISLHMTFRFALKALRYNLNVNKLYSLIFNLDYKMFKDFILQLSSCEKSLYLS